MVDPTSDHNEDIDADDAPDCETCGATLTDAPNHRVITWIDDGAVETAHFCDDACRSKWTGQ